MLSSIRGGTSPYFECVTFRNNTDNIDALTPQSQLQVQSQPDQPQLLPPTTNTPTIDACPKCNLCMPICDNDPCYLTTSYRPQQHASMAWTDILNDLKTYSEAMRQPDTEMWELACENEKCQFETMGMYEVVL